MRIASMTSSVVKEARLYMVAKAVARGVERALEKAGARVGAAELKKIVLALTTEEKREVTDSLIEAILATMRGDGQPFRADMAPKVVRAALDVILPMMQKKMGGEAYLASQAERDDVVQEVVDRVLAEREARMPASQKPAYAPVAAGNSVKVRVARRKKASPGDVGLKRMDHAAYQKKLRGLPEESLRYIIKDAREAMKANPENPNNGYYQDEISYAAMELKRRGLSA
jgi:hypothetical protein